MIIDGRKIAQRILESLNPANKLRLAAVLVGQNPELKKFIELKKKAAEGIGIDFQVYEFPEDIANDELEKELNKIAQTETNNGVIIELPLPTHLDTQHLLNLIPEEKDVDVLSQKSQDDFLSGKIKVLPPAVEAVKQIFEEYNIETKGKKAAVFGYGLLVGKPVSHWLTQQRAIVSIITEDTKEPEKISKKADIIISGVGQPNLITKNMVKEGVVVIDFGKDVDFEEVSKQAGLITPPVGGIGPIVVVAVLKNLVELNS